ncbi:MAG: hypothetical protein AAFU85_01270 [Planctomycetota bacterium]
MSATQREAIDPIGASPQSGCLIWQTPNQWRMVVGGLEHSLPAKTPIQEVAEEARQLAGQFGPAGRRCVFGIPSTECFFANLATEEIGTVKDRSAVAFELERFFPLDAEAMVADFTVDRTGSRIAAVCVEGDRQRDLIDELESHDIDVTSVLPASFLIARGLVGTGDISGPFEMILAVSNDYESLVVDDDGVWHWKTLFGETGLNQHLALDEENQSPLVLVDCRDLKLETTRSVQHCEESAGRLAVYGSDQVLTGQWGRWIELRRGALAPADPLRAIATPLRWLALTAAVCLILVSFAAGYRSQRISEAIMSIKDEQRAAFRKAFPDRRVPVMLERTVRSEHRRAMGARGKGDSIKLPTPATGVLRQLYVGLERATSEADARFRITDLSINDGECSLTVRARNSVDIGAIAKTLESVGFLVQPPGSEQIEPSKDEPIATYESTIKAVWTDEADREVDKP